MFSALFKKKKKKIFILATVILLSIWIRLKFCHVVKYSSLTFYIIYFILKIVTSNFVNSLPNNKILNWSKLKAFVDDKIRVNEKLKFGLGRVENIVGIGDSAGYQHFLLFPQWFRKAAFSRLLKVGIVW